MIKINIEEFEKNREQFEERIKEEFRNSDYNIRIETDEIGIPKYIVIEAVDEN